MSKQTSTLTACLALTMTTSSSHKQFFFATEKLLNCSITDKTGCKKKGMDSLHRFIQHQQQKQQLQLRANRPWSSDTCFIGSEHVTMKQANPTSPYAPQLPGRCEQYQPPVNHGCYHCQMRSNNQDYQTLPCNLTSREYTSSLLLPDSNENSQQTRELQQHLQQQQLQRQPPPQDGPDHQSSADKQNTNQHSCCGCSSRNTTITVLLCTLVGMYVLTCASFLFVLCSRQRSHNLQS